MRALRSAFDENKEGRDSARWLVYGLIAAGLAAFAVVQAQDVIIGRSRIRGLKPLIEGRRQFLDNVPELRTARPDLSNLAHAPSIPLPTQTVYITVKASNAASKPA